MISIDSIEDKKHILVLNKLVHAFNTDSGASIIDDMVLKLSTGTPGPLANPEMRSAVFHAKHDICHKFELEGLGAYCSSYVFIIDRMPPKEDNSHLLGYIGDAVTTFGEMVTSDMLLIKNWSKLITEMDNNKYKLLPMFEEYADDGIDYSAIMDKLDRYNDGKYNTTYQVAIEIIELTGNDANIISKNRKVKQYLDESKMGKLLPTTAEYIIDLVDFISKITKG